jgi:putative oxidoreductase
LRNHLATAAYTEKMRTAFEFRRGVLAMAAKVSWLGPLLARLTLGAMFAGTGWGKLHSLPDVTAFFRELGIPAPGFHAHLVASTELAGGIAILAGFATRLAGVPLAVTMVVAIVTAKRSEVDGVRALLALEEFTYFCLLAWLVLAGAGAASVDALLARKLDRGPPDAQPA